MKGDGDMEFRSKILEMVALLVCPFDAMIDATAVEGMDGVAPELIPDPAKKLLAFIKEKLAANRAGYEDAIVDVVKRHLSESDVESILAFNKSAVGARLRSCTTQIQNDLSEANIHWRNETLELHLEEVKLLMGVTEPAPLDDDVLDAPNEPPPSAG